jgi:mannose-6-phosphate isomerase
MSFMFNPHPYDDPTAVNRPNLPGEVINSIVSGTKEVAGYLTKVIIEKLEKGNVIVALDGYSSAIFDQIVNLLSQNLKLKSIEIKSFDVRNILKTPLELDLLFKENLPEDREKDPVSLFGKLFKGSYEDLFDAKKANQFEATLGV